MSLGILAAIKLGNALTAEIVTRAGEGLIRASRNV